MRLPVASAQSALLLASTASAGCGGIQSALAPAGREAARIADLFWWMAAGALLVWASVLVLAWWCVQAGAGTPSPRRDRAIIIGGGIVIPVLVLTALLVYGLSMLPPIVARAPDHSLQIAVVGEQWWWRVRYERPGGAVDLANEIRIPVGKRVQFRLESDNVIHSFWIPSLAGKMDMIPGRTTYLAVEALRTGVFRGACAEYCGASHALMAFDVDVVEEAAFNSWLDQQAADAAVPTGGPALHGRELFASTGCGACHTVRGTPARGTIGPDLTHVGSRRSLGAAVLRNDAEAFARWIARTDHIKPGVHMPPFGMLPRDTIAALAAYLESLK